MWSSQSLGRQKTCAISGTRYADTERCCHLADVDIRPRGRVSQFRLWSLKMAWRDWPSCEFIVYNVLRIQRSTATQQLCPYSHSSDVTALRIASSSAAAGHILQNKWYSISVLFIKNLAKQTGIQLSRSTVTIQRLFTNRNDRRCVVRIAVNCTWGQCTRRINYPIGAASNVRRTSWPIAYQQDPSNHQNGRRTCKVKFYKL